MKKPSSFALAAVAAAAAFTGTAQAESTYGYNSAGTGTVSATARVDLRVVVPKLVILKVGTAGSGAASVDLKTWNVGISIPAGAVTPAVTADSVGVTWNGAAPTVSVATTTQTVAAAAWTNASNILLNCATSGSTFGAGVTAPSLADITVGVGAGTLAHPGPNLNACAATAALSANSALASTYTYTLGGTPAGWLPGSYDVTVTYTAAGT